MREERLETSELRLGTPMRGVLDFSERLTRQRNERELPSPLHRGMHLTLGARDMWTTLTRVRDEARRLELFRIIAPKVALRIFTALQELGEKDEFVERLIENYTVCKRCGKLPCMCDPVERSTNEYKAERLEGQEQWSLSEWHRHLGKMYGKANCERGLILTIGQLSSETAEVAEAILKMDQAKGRGDLEKVEEHRQEAIDELSQCLAWLIGVCNVVEPNSSFVSGNAVEADLLERSFVEIYGKGCPRCNEIPCVCEGFTWLEPRKDPQTLSKKTL